VIIIGIIVFIVRNRRRQNQDNTYLDPTADMKMPSNEETDYAISSNNPSDGSGDYIHTMGADEEYI
jgi:hypothetical protein